MSALESRIRPITTGPGFHWFGYYDKLQFDPTGRWVLGMRVSFQHRSPRAVDEIEIGMVDLADGDRWIRLGTSAAWCWQQGCMLQWRPGSASEVLWNDREGHGFVCRILNVESGRMRTVPRPIYTVSPDGRTALAPDFRRINENRPGYGYAGFADPWRDRNAPRESGIERVDLENGSSRPILSIAEVGEVPGPNPPPAGLRQWFNHLLFNTDGSRFVFLHRWRSSDGSGRLVTRALTADPDGGRLHLVSGHGLWSHFIWRDARHLLSWSGRPVSGDALHLWEDLSGRVEAVGAGVIRRDSHVSYLPGGEWIAGDSYPDGGGGQSLFLYHPASGRMEILGTLPAPKEFSGEWRCDLHPRFSPDGRFLCVDSPHLGPGRQMYLIDVGDLARAH